MSNPLSEMSGEQMDHLIAALDSLVDGELAVTMLVACGQRAIPYLERFLLQGAPKTIALPRRRAVRALGELGACSTLMSYFREYGRPKDAAVLLAEDAVRSAVARELLRWKSEEVFQVLLDAARRRATGDLILALGEFHKPESVPLLFEVLEDDLCREEAKDGLRKVPEDARHYAILSIRELTGAELRGPSALRRRRATLQLLDEFGVSPDEWPDLRGFLLEEDADVVIAAAQIGLRVGPNDDRPPILKTLFRISDKINWVQEDQVATLLDSHRGLAGTIASQIARERRARGEQPNWMMPSWRILRHVLGSAVERVDYGAA